jgi:NAD-reducing hydrogenase small subunit
VSPTPSPKSPPSGSTVAPDATCPSSTWTSASSPSPKPHSPVVDPKDFPEDVAVTLVEGAVSNDHDLAVARTVRERSKLVVSLGDCAVTSNVPSMRNPYKHDQLLARAYVENATVHAAPPDQYVPPLQPHARPLHEVIDVDLFLPGCPPPADAIHHAITEVLAGRTPDPSALTRFGM